MSKKKIVIFLSQLEKAQVLDYDGDLPAEVFEVEDSEFLSMHDKLHYKFQARYHVGGVEVKGSAWTDVESKCGRCLKNLTEKVEVKLNLFFDEIKDIEDLNITEEVREELMVAIPMNFICSDDCQGLCPNCGVNLNDKKCKCHKEIVEEPSVWDALNDLNL